jgi:hypothetical protein
MILGFGDGVTTSFALPNNSAQVLGNGTDSTLQFWVSGTLQVSGTNYNMSGNNVVFVSAPVAQAVILWNGQTLDRGN